MTIDLSKPLSELIVEIATNPRTAAQQMQDMQTRLNGRTYFHSDAAVERELAEVRAELAAAKELLTEISECEYVGDQDYRVPWGENEGPEHRAMRFLSTPSSADKVQAVLEAAETAEYVIKDILDSLPENRDWLNPETERMAKDVIRALREKG
jgi:hypothetical protein